MSDDPERLLAEALRAQARHAPPEQSAAHRLEPPPPVVETPGGYGLLSGAGEGSLERERAALDEITTEAPSSPEAQPKAAPVAGPLRLSWLIAFTVLLGLAAGCVIGLLTLV
ncbi:hypothetical protein [Prauserella cavernicola]|uniref:Uncharacterized protein n=1 Tax=Prauserella cavernicola TaxID=2800127 RepID=A0A934QRC2_9PSEU|nr:hypothetical protein [Prauserella cavernicola]MBK1784756.1 hypothetical protein [Prauserella cavernicola]